MGENYTVKQGDYLSRIATEHGFADYHTIWDHPQNSGLKQQRQNPNILYPGDQLYIPDRGEKTEPGPTEKRHRFQTDRSELKLRIAIQSSPRKPVSGKTCHLVVEGKDEALVTDAKGLVETVIASTADFGAVHLTDLLRPIDLDVPLKIGHLDPLDTESGQMARLNNLGYRAGELGKTPTSPDERRRLQDQMRSAVEEFQCDYGLFVDGKCGKITQGKLKEAHGC